MVCEIPHFEHNVDTVYVLIGSCMHPYCNYDQNHKSDVTVAILSQRRRPVCEGWVGISA